MKKSYNIPLRFHSHCRAIAALLFRVILFEDVANYFFVLLSFSQIPVEVAADTARAVVDVGVEEVVDTTRTGSRMCPLRNKFITVSLQQGWKLPNFPWIWSQILENIWHFYIFTFLLENDINNHLNDQFTLKIANISLQKQNFLGMRFPNSTFCPCIVSKFCLWVGLIRMLVIEARNLWKVAPILFGFQQRISQDPSILSNSSSLRESIRLLHSCQGFVRI